MVFQGLKEEQMERDTMMVERILTRNESLSEVEFSMISTESFSMKGSLNVLNDERVLTRIEISPAVAVITIEGTCSRYIPIIGWQGKGFFLVWINE
jgi:hypothetical protein